MGLQAKGIGKAYPGLTVLDGLDLDVADGEVLAVVGISGTGKSTLLNILGLMDRPDVGEVHLDGERIDHLPQKSRCRLRARCMGFVFQAFNLLPEFTVIENVLMAARCAEQPLGPATAHAEKLLDAVGLLGRRDGDIRVLSGGERQRVALCRALLCRPALLLADEPTGNLDPQTAEIILATLVDLARQERSSVIIVTHDPAIAGRADRRLELREGKLHPRA